MEALNFVHEYTDKDQDIFPDDSLEKAYIDCYPSDPDKEGQTAVVVTLTKNGDICIDWHLPEARDYAECLEILQEVIDELKDDYREYTDHFNDHLMHRLKTAYRLSGSDIHRIKVLSEEVIASDSNLKQFGRWYIAERIGSLVHAGKLDLKEEIDPSKLTDLLKEHTSQIFKLRD